MGAIYDDLPDHEGHSIEDGGMHVGACSCGWRDAIGVADHDAAGARWDTTHAATLLERAVPAEITEDLTRTRRAIIELARARPKAAIVVLDGLERSIAQLRSLVQERDLSAPTVAQRLAALPTRGRSPGIDR